MKSLLSLLKAILAVFPVEVGEAAISKSELVAELLLRENLSKFEPEGA